MSEHIETTAGNMAAMRKALQRVCYETRSYCSDFGAGESHKSLAKRMIEDPPDYTCLRDSILEIDRIVDAALSSPARNCDRFGDELDAQLAFLNEEWLIDVDRKTMLVKDQFENWTCYMRSRYARWLMAPAVKKQNQKGE